MDTVNDPIFSVVIPAHNAAPWIADAVAGVLGQTFQDLEIIVVDDGSTDDTAAILAGRDARLRLLRQPQAGSAAARNRGILEARGAFIAFLDADDLWLPDKLQRQLDLFQRHPDLVWCYSDALFFEDRSGRVLFAQSQIQRQVSGWILRPLLLSDFIPVSTVVVRRWAMDRIGCFDPAWLTSEDWDLWLRLAAHWPAGYVPEPLAKYRVHSGQKTQAIAWKTILAKRLGVIAAAITRNPEQLADLGRRAQANVHSNVGWMLFQQGQDEPAGRLFRKAVSICPSSLRAWVYWLASLVPRRLLTAMVDGLRKLRKFLRSERRVQWAKPRRYRSD